MNTKLQLLFLLLLITNFISCQQNRISIITGKVEYPLSEISIGGETIELNAKNEFLFQKELAHNTILELDISGETYEVFLQPGKTVRLRITEESILFNGDLVQENEYLLSEKVINDEVNEYLNKNWYTIHHKNEANFAQLIDSLKGIYSINLTKSEANLSSDLVEVNQASINYAFDRMILRYPEWHERFTGNKVELSPDRMKHINTHLLNAKFFLLTSYQRYFRTWLDLELKDELISLRDTSMYNGYTRLQGELAFISENIEDIKLRDFWSFEYIKAHIDQYTWANGQQFLHDFKSSCQTPLILNEINKYEREILTARKGHEIIVYKSAKGHKLEAHIFKPESFDSTKTYPVLAAFHGGGWMGGHAEWTFESAKQATDNGMIGIAIEYRLSNRDDITPFEAIKDTRDAIQWIRANAESLNIDPTKVVAKGISAGGHLALSVSVLDDSILAIKPNARPNALILVSPAIDTQDQYVKSLLRKETDPSSISPLENIKAGMQMPNTLILQGQTDSLTPTIFATAFKAKMDSLGYNCTLKIYEDCGHLFTPSHLDDTGMPQSDPEISELAYQEQLTFLRALGYVKNP